MSISTPVVGVAAKTVRLTDRALVVELLDGRSVSVPLEWYPRLAEGTARERELWVFTGPGIGIHWPALDEDISIEGIMQGRRSGEGAESLERWRASRKRRSGGRLARRRTRAGGRSRRA
jgi:uncharacterized protein DUF2442